LRSRSAADCLFTYAHDLPDLVSARINGCVPMMAEMASDLIRGRAAI
jgi:hypothetical protein